MSGFENPLKKWLDENNEITQCEYEDTTVNDMALDNNEIKHESVKPEGGRNQNGMLEHSDLSIRLSE